MQCIPQPDNHCCAALLLLLLPVRRVKSAVGSSTSFGGLPTIMDYTMSGKDEDVVDSNFMHDRYAPQAGGHKGDALVVATPHKVFTLAGDD
jgi:hypothetical protein